MEREWKREEEGKEMGGRGRKERAIKLYNLLCQKVNCTNRTLSDIILALLVSIWAVLDKSFNQSECPLLFLLLPLMSFTFSLFLKCWCFSEFYLYTFFFIPSVLKFSLVDLTPFASAKRWRKLNVYTLWHRIWLSGIFLCLSKLGPLEWTNLGVIYINYSRNDGSCRFAM